MTSESGRNQSKISSVIAAIPARAGSKGISDKNFRIVGGLPLIAHTIKAALDAKSVDRVIVSTDSLKIADIAKQYGAEVPFLRPIELAGDDITLAPVMRHLLQWTKEEGINTGILVILEPTSPLRSSSDIDEAVNVYRQEDVDTVISVERVNSLEWTLNEDKSPIPIHEERLNRQEMKPIFKENGAIFVTDPDVVTEETTIGEDVALYEMDSMSSVDVNTFWEMKLADLLLRQVKIVFHFKASADLGFGHFYRILEIANRLHWNDIVLLCSEYDEGLEEKIQQVGFRYILANNPVEVLKQEKPTILINDILDTSLGYMEQVREFVPLIANFEDLGEGRILADMVFNALYDDFSLDLNHYGGALYAIMRSEFLFIPKRVINERIQLITATFGGSDPKNLAYHCMKELPSEFPEIDFRIIIGPGYAHDKKGIAKLSEKHSNVILIDESTQMADHFTASDLAITSGGRTVFEAASCGTPCVVMCQNLRELRHRHITSRDGILNLGLFEGERTMDDLVQVIKKLSRNPSQRMVMSERASSLVDGLGVFRVIGLMEKTAREKGILSGL